MEDFCEEITAQPQSQEKERCQYTHKEFKSENDKVYFRCGHYYHRQTFRYERLGVFVCQTFGCLIKTPAQRAQPPTRVFDVDTERYVDEDDIDAEVTTNERKLLPKYVSERKRREKQERRDKRREERRRFEEEREMNSDPDWTPDSIITKPKIDTPRLKVVSDCRRCGNARVRGSHKMIWGYLDGVFKKHQACKGVDF